MNFTELGIIDIISILSHQDITDIHYIVDVNCIVKLSNLFKSIHNAKEKAKLTIYAYFKLNRLQSKQADRRKNSNIKEVHCHIRHFFGPFFFALQCYMISSCFSTASKTCYKLYACMYDTVRSLAN